MFLLAVRSYYSLMGGCSSPERICRRARELGFTGVALTDCNSLIGLWEFLAACQKHGLRPIVGARIEGGDPALSITCLVQNSIGYINLCNWVSQARKTPNFDMLSCSEFPAEGLHVLASSLSLLQHFHQKKMDVTADLGSRVTEQGSRLRKWAMENGIPAVMSSRAVMATGEEQDLFTLMQAIGSNTLFRSGRREEKRAYCIEPPEVYRERFAVWPEVVSVTEHLAESCRFSGPQFGLVMPPWQSQGTSAACSLRKKAYRGARVRYGDDLSEAVVERLEYELKIIDAMNFSSYFLVVRDIVHDQSSTRNTSTPRICGRGSGAASLVAYCLEITNVCPLKHNLYFERFLNPGRSDAPDIDIDFAWDERDAILDRVLKRYANHAAMVATIIRFQPRMAIRETAKAFGLTAGEIGSRIKSLRSKVQGQDALAQPWPKILSLAAQLIDIPRHISVHPGGVVITPEPLQHYVPVELAQKGVPIIQWDKDSAETAGLVKIDLLGNRSLGVIRDCIDSIAARGRNFDEEYWQPEEDPATKKSIAAGKTMGCFYIESPAMRLLQQKARSGDFEQLVLQSSIIRPAANEFVREYVRRLHGGSWHHLHPKLRNVLDETYGLMVYQEDVARVAVAVAGFSHAQADGLRKVMSKKDKVLRLRDYKAWFESGCAANAIGAATQKRLWDMMMSFDGYSFCKAHSASYARVSYQAAYLKTHYPAEFMAAVISNQGGYYPTFAYVSEAKRLGITILPPCVNRSGIRWHGKGDEIRVGLQAICDLSHKGMQSIIGNRQEKRYGSTIDFWRRVELQQDENRALIQAGALDSLSGNGNRSVMAWELAQFTCTKNMQRTSSLFAIQLPSPPELPDVAPVKRLHQEYNTLGFLCNTHPLLLYGTGLRGRVKGCDLPSLIGRHVLFGGWLISGKIVSTKTGEVMEFLTFEDETALVETVFFPEVYRRYATRLSTGKAYLLWGLVEEEFGATTLTVHKVKSL